MPNYRTSPSTDPQPRDDAIVHIRGLALSLGAERTQHRDEGARQAFTLIVGQLSTTVTLENDLVDQILHHRGIDQAVRSQLEAALAGITAG